jgi:hypothetical protein
LRCKNGARAGQARESFIDFAGAVIQKVLRLAAGVCPTGAKKVDLSSGFESCLYELTINLIVYFHALSLVAESEFVHFL